MIYERLWKSFDNDRVVHAIQNENFDDPVLWTDPEGGYWIEYVPTRVVTLEDLA